MALTGGGPRLLALRALGLGDLLTAVPAYRALRRAFPRHWLVLAAPPALAPLALLSGAIDEVLPAHRLGPLGWSGRPPEVAVNLHGRGPQSHQVLRELHPGQLWAFAHSAHPEVAGPGWRPGEHEVDRWCRLLRHYGVSADPAALDLPVPAGRHSPAPGAVVVHPGASAADKRWPPERFTAVAAALHRAGHRVVVTGSTSERGLASGVARGAGLDRADLLAGRTDALDLAALVADAELVICTDTGIGHLASGYRTRSVLLFGPTSPAEWGPPPGRPQHRVLQPVGSEHTARWPLAGISVATVLGAAEQLLAHRAAATRQPGSRHAPARPVPSDGRGGQLVDREAAGAAAAP